MALPAPLRSASTATGLALVALSIGVSALIYALVSGAGSSGVRGTVQVDATGNATGTPDVLTVQLAVITKASSAARALNQNNVEMHHLQAVFIGAGVASKDLQTSNLDVSPNYDKKGSVSSYGAEDDLSATLRSIKRSGAVIDAAENAVGNDVQINGIAFSISNEAPLNARARIVAMHNARAQAEEFASGAGERLGAALKVTTSVNSPAPVPLGRTSAAAVPGVAPVPVRPGTQSVSVSVDVIFAMQ